MSRVPARLREQVIARDRERCEYCLVNSLFATFTHEVDHVIARQHGGTTALENLAYACAQCNRFKGSNIAAPDPQTGDIVTLFNPRTQDWSSHFLLDGPTIPPRTASGRATERLLQLNQVDRLLLRQELIHMGQYPFPK